MKIGLGISTASSNYIINKRIKKISNYINFNQSKILDVGCGDGAYTAALAKKAKIVYGIDIQLRELEKSYNLISQSKLANLKFICMDAQKIAFLNNSFDIILMIESLEHMQDQEKVLENLYNILKENGVLILYVPNRFFPLEGHGAHIGRLNLSFRVPFLPWLPNKISKYFINARNYTSNSIRNLLIRKGFTVHKIDFLFPPCDKLEKKLKKFKLGFIAAVLRKILKKMENTFLKIFGMSILIIACKQNP
jgi:2-polyprenyl-3-methyl-5-hydroxy-6-metoxy-1,4-benzoquinol methylase